MTEEPKSDNKYHPEDRVNTLIEVGVRLSTKYVQHLQAINRLNALEGCIKQALKVSKMANDKAARKDAQEMAKQLDHLRSQKTPDFSSECGDFVRACVPWMQDIEPPPMPEVSKKYM